MCRRPLKQKRFLLSVIAPNEKGASSSRKADVDRVDYFLRWLSFLELKEISHSHSGRVESPVLVLKEENLGIIVRGIHCQSVCCSIICEIEAAVALMPLLGEGQFI